MPPAATPPTPAEPSIVLAGPASVLDFELPSFIQVPESMAQAIATGTADAASAALLEKFSTKILTPAIMKVPLMGEMLVGSDFWSQHSGAFSAAILYLLMFIDSRYTQHQLSTCAAAGLPLKATTYFPPVVAALVLLAARRYSGNFALAILPALRGFMAEAKSDLDSLGTDFSGTRS